MVNKTHGNVIIERIPRLLFTTFNRFERQNSSARKHKDSFCLFVKSL